MDTSVGPDQIILYESNYGMQSLESGVQVFWREGAGALGRLKSPSPSQSQMPTHFSARRQWRGGMCVDSQGEILRFSIKQLDYMIQRLCEKRTQYRVVD